MGALKVEDIPRYTYDDYKLWDGNWELIEGYPYAMAPAPMIKHQNISAKIARYLSEAFENCDDCQVLMPIDWRISDGTIVQPDNSVICHKPKNEEYITKSPVIIFEILSKSTAKKDTGIKFDLYEREAVQYYIIVDLKHENAKVYHLKNGKYIKLCDATNEEIAFKINSCNNRIKFDFSKLWN